MIFGQSKKFTATTASLPAPIGGWNARDSLAEMSPTDAVQLTNFFPTPYDVELRKGYTKFSTGISGQVNSLMTYAGPTSQTLFAAAGTKIYNASTSTATTSFTGLTNDKLQHINFSNIGGDYLVACNGADPTLVYDGTNWIKIATTSTAQTISSITHVGNVATLTTSAPHGLITGNQVVISGATPNDYNGAYIITVTGTTTFTYTMATTPSGNASVVGTYTVLGITGVDSSTFVHVNLFKNRLYFTQENTLKVWYLPTNAIGGAAQVLDFGGIARNGGYIQAMGTWTLDAGYGVDDFAVFITNMGEVIVYQGTDPSSDSTWALKGVWQIGYVFNRRCFFKWAGDLLILTNDGLMPLTAELQSSRLDPRIALTDKIFQAVATAAQNYNTNFGWQIMYFAKPQMLILNIPISGGTQQYVMHTITKSWANFTGINTTCFQMYYDNCYFGGSGFVGQFWNGNSDAGTNINATAQQAYNYFDARGQLKRWTMVRPIIQTDKGVPTVFAGLSLDFDAASPVNTLSFNPALVTEGIWDTSDWDVGKWGNGLVTTKNWQGVAGVGYAASLTLNIASQNIELHWDSTDFVMEKGGIL
jgi:hypothetical protein